MNKERHTAKVEMLARALAKRHGRSAFEFVSKELDNSDEANRATWRAVLDALPR